MRLSSKLALISFAFFFPVMLVAIWVNAPGALVLAAFVAGLMCAAFLYFKLEPLSEIVETLESVAQGKEERPTLSEDGDAEIQRLAIATNQLKIQYEESLRRARDLAAGRIGIADIEERVLRTGAISDADEMQKNTDGPLEDAMIGLTNQMRRLTIQARIISKDRLSSALLDERVPGELGEAFSMMVRNLRALTDRAQKIADGDLTHRVAGEGVLTAAFNQMVDRFEALSEEINQTAIHISSSAEQILAVLREQEFAASHQASGVEETQRTMETLLSSAKRIAESAQTVFKSAEKTQANNRTVAERIAELKTHTERIGEILEVIKSIADRSDLLALNASLEGMRAGEAGKGFTLVAAEMRRLAESIKESVGDIKELLSDIRESALSSVMATEEGSSLSERTTESALKITLITQQQQSGTEQVTQSMDELSTLINHGVAGMRQVTTASDELVQMAEDLRVVVEQFQTAAPNASTSGDFPRRRTAKRRRNIPGREQVSEAAERAIAVAAASAHEESRAVVQRLAESSDAAIAAVSQELSEASEGASSGRKKTLPMSAVDDPPTVELTGLSEEEERTMLAEALRASSKQENDDDELSDVSEGSEHRETGSREEE